ncbi:MAG: hypothetical protein FD129_1040, partial [bacterium]
TPDGVGADCPTPQDCLDQAASGDTLEFGAGTFDAVADTLVDDGMGGQVTALLVARRSTVLRAADGADVRINGQWEPGRIGLAIPAGNDTIEVTGLRFDNCDAGIRVTNATLRVEDCVFVSGQHGLVADGAALDIRDSDFSEFAAEAALMRACRGTMSGCTFLGNNYGLFVANPNNLRIENSLVSVCCLTGIRIEEGGMVTLAGLTVTRVGMVPDDSTGIVVAGGAHALVERCVIADNRGFGIDCRAGGTVTVTCSDIVNHSSGNYHGCADATGTSGNLSVNPGFCAPDDLNFHLAADSPARLAACGPMGAFPEVSCAAISLSAATAARRGRD